MSELSQKKCVPCQKGTRPLSYTESKRLLESVPEWRFVHELANHPFIDRIYSMNSFQEALDFIVKIGALAEQEGHHPDIHLTKYRQVRLQLMTHTVRGLTQSDFILAAKIDEIHK